MGVIFKGDHAIQIGRQDRTPGVQRYGTLTENQLKNTACYAFLLRKSQFCVKSFLCPLLHSLPFSDDAVSLVKDIRSITGTEDTRDRGMNSDWNHRGHYLIQSKMSKKCSIRSNSNPNRSLPSGKEHEGESKKESYFLFMS